MSRFMDISKETCWKLLDHHYASVTWEIQEEKQEKRKHAERVLGICQEIMGLLPQRVQNCVDAEKLNAAAILHDIAKFDNDDEHHKLALKIIQKEYEWLEAETKIVPFEKRDLLQIGNIIRYHKGKKYEPDTLVELETAILRMADKIDKLDRVKNAKDSKKRQAETSYKDSLNKIKASLDGDYYSIVETAIEAACRKVRFGTMSHTAEIIAVGTELLLGNIANTNAQVLSESLSTLGIDVFWHTVVGDNPERLREALAIARRRADIILTTGGLGPTYDDLTKQTICEAFHQKLVLHPDILEDIRSFYETALHVPMPENNTQQAELPEGCTVFDNPVGTAPGCAFEAEGVHVLMFPGPPHEMKTMLRRCGEPYLRKLSKEVIVSRDIMTFGIGESSVDELLHETMSQMTNPTLATYAKPSEVRLRATAKAATEAEAQAMLNPVWEMVCKTLGNVVYGADVSGLAEVCYAQLLRRGLTLATAESCTGGLVAERMTAISGASKVYRGGVVSYWTSVKAEVLGVPQGLLDAYGAVSEETARAMAEGVCRITGADVGVSVTGVAGPDPDERGVPVGIVYIGLATPEGTFCRKMDSGRKRRDRIQGLAANHAFDVVRRWLMGLPVETV